MYDARMLTWVSRSIYSHFDIAYKALTPTPNWPMYFEGDLRILKADILNKVEIRFDGPHIRERSKGSWLFQVKMNALISCSVEDDLYGKEHMLEQVVPMFAKMIPVYNYGEINPVLIDCLALQSPGSLSGKTGLLKISNLGQVQLRLPLLQTTVDANYAMVFKE